MKNGVMKLLVTPLTAALMAGCGAFAAASAARFSIAWYIVYGAAMVSAFLMTAGARSTVRGVMTASVIVVCAGITAAWGIQDVSAAVTAIGSAEAVLHTRGAMVLILVPAWLCSALFVLLMRAESGRPLCLLITLSTVVISLALNEEVSLWTAVPALVGALLAFAVPANREGTIRTAAVLPAIVLVMLAMFLVPGGRITWAPLENLAQQLRSLTQDYFHFTQERVAFSINEEGYDHAGMIDDTVVAMLGGKATPDETPVMRVDADRDILLRGTVRRTYTGYSWVDDTAKSRYLYYDITHKAVRSRVFGTDRADTDGFVRTGGSVTFMGEGTSTLFVPSHLTEFTMDMKDAVYYNSAGEIFLTRRVQAGDTYTFESTVPRNDEALLGAAAAAELSEDDAFEAIRAEYTAVPDGIDTQVYALAAQLTQNYSGDAQKALAICDYLAKNYSYTLDGAYPPEGKDFVSWFLLEEKQGYCSYFASAMAVLCRLANIPVRYAEGYYVCAGESTDITGRNAHAWVEVYLRGIGWTAFDPTARTVGLETGEDKEPDDQKEGGSENSDNGNAEDEQSGDGEESGPSGKPESTPEPDDRDGAGDNEPDLQENDSDEQSEPSPEPDSVDDPWNAPEEDNNGALNGEDNDDAGYDGGTDEEQSSGASSGRLWWLPVLLVLIALIAAAILLIRRRLKDTDPIACAAQADGAMTAALILYRACLNILACEGIIPQPSETAEAFATRAAQSVKAPQLIAFASALSAARYSGRDAEKETVKLGRSAYRALAKTLGRREMLRYTVGRVLRGNGSIEQIP